MHYMNATSDFGKRYADEMKKTVIHGEVVVIVGPDDKERFGVTMGVFRCADVHLHSLIFRINLRHTWVGGHVVCVPVVTLVVVTVVVVTVVCVCVGGGGAQFLFTVLCVSLIVCVLFFVFVFLVLVTLQDTGQREDGRCHLCSNQPRFRSECTIGRRCELQGACRVYRLGR